MTLKHRIPALLTAHFTLQFLKYFGNKQKFFCQIYSLDVVRARKWLLLRCFPISNSRIIIYSISPS